MKKPLQGLVYENGAYKTLPGGVSLAARISPTIVFYCRLAQIIFRSSSMAKRSAYGTSEWVSSSLEVLRALEDIGANFEITGVDNFRGISGPCVFIANHMSTLETFVLPAIIAAFKDATFVVKESLVDYPVFKYVMRSRDPVTVGRANPRDDLRAVLEGGEKRLKAGRSIVIFPQTTRSTVFDPKMFNTIGIKLAKKADVPIIPVALKTDAWRNGSLIKDFGGINPSSVVHFAFGKPLFVKDKGGGEHGEIIDFISSRLREWDE